MTVSPISQAQRRDVPLLLGFDGEDNEIADFVDDRAQIVATHALRRLTQFLGALTGACAAIQQGADVDDLIAPAQPGVSRDTTRGADPGPVARGDRGWGGATSVGGRSPQQLV